MEQVQLSISRAQMSKIIKGLPIQIKHESMGNGDIVVSLHPENAKKMMSALSVEKVFVCKWTKMKLEQVVYWMV